MTRRAALAGLGALVVVPRRAAAAAGGDPLRVGVVRGLGFDAAGLGAATRARWGRPAVPVPFPAWGSLADHAAVAADGVIDAAVLPAEGVEDPLLALPAWPGLLLLRTARPRRIGVALHHPKSEAVLRGLLAQGSGLTLLAMPPAMLVGNLEADVIDAALLVGADALVANASTVGLTAVPLGPALTAALLPPLCLRLRSGAQGDQAA